MSPLNSTVPRSTDYSSNSQFFNSVLPFTSCISKIYSSFIELETFLPEFWTIKTQISLKPSWTIPLSLQSCYYWFHKTRSSSKSSSLWNTSLVPPLSVPFKFNGSCKSLALIHHTFFWDHYWIYLNTLTSMNEEKLFFFIQLGKGVSLQCTVSLSFL